MANLLDSWDSASNTRRTTLVMGFIAIVALSVLALIWLNSKEYQVLFSDLEARDAANVVSELERLKIDHKLAAAGSEVLVPASEVHNIRLKLMGSGLPLGGGVGFEIFDESDFGMTDFAQKINYQRALEGELTRTIMSLKEVKYARVHLVMPERGLFQQDDSAPSASVTLFLKQEYLTDSSRPTPIQIQGIQRLVSSSVPDLKTNQVTVSDQTGVTLSQMLSDQKDMVAITGRLQQKQAIEDYLMEKVNTVLTHTFGEGQAMVSIDVTLNFSEVKRTLEDVVQAEDSADGVLRRRETRMSTGADNKNTGANVTTEIEYKLGRKIEQTVESPGEITRLSVGIMVPETVSEQRRTQIRELVEVTVGLNVERGDALALYTVDTPDLISPDKNSVFPQATDPMQPGTVSMNTNTQSKTLSQALLELVSQRPFITGALGASLALLMLFGLFKLIMPGPKAEPETRRLSASERQEILLKLNGWLESSNSTGKSNRV